MDTARLPDARVRFARWMGAVAVALVALTLVPLGVAAHVALVGATPVPGSTVGQSPKAVRVRLDQIPDPKFSQITLLDTSGQMVAGGPGTADSSDPSVLGVALGGTLAPGLYTVVWQALAPDGHLTRGNYTFTLAAGLGPAAPAEPQSIGAPTSSGGAASVAGGGNPTAVAVLVRWLRYLALGALIGACGLAVFVLRPATAGMADGAAQWARAARLAEPWVLGGVTAFLVAHAATTVVQAATVADIPILSVRADTLRRLLFDTTYGAFWRVTAGIALVVFAGMLAARLPLRRSQAHALGIVAAPRAVDRAETLPDAPVGVLSERLLLAGALLLCAALPFSSHAVESQHQPVLVLMADAAHLAAMGLWFGGLLVLLAILRPWLRPLDAAARADLLARTVGRFSNMALLSVGALVATGLYAMTIHMTRETILNTTYGQTLLIKHALVLPLIGTAAINLLRIKPRLHASARARRWLPRLLMIESALGLAVLLVTGLLTQLPPAHVLSGVNAAAADPRLANATANPPPVAIAPSADLDLTSGPQSSEMQDGPGMVVVLRTTLGKDGSTLEANIVDPQSIQPLPDIQRVTALVTFAGADLGQTSAPLARGADGLYHAAGILFPIKGVWNIQLVIRRANVAEDTRLNFSFTSDPARFQTALPPAFAAPRYATGFLWPRLLPNAWFGVAIAGVGALLLLAMRSRRAALRGQAAAIYCVWSIGTILVGLVVFGYSSVDRTPTTGVVNPVPNDATAVARGAQVFAQNCAVCHGPQGRGDGTYGQQLNPRPANLVGGHATTHTDGDLYWWISHGVSGTGMPAFTGTLSDRDLWSVIRYLRTLGGSR